MFSKSVETVEAEELELVEAVKRLGYRYGCRIEICSHDSKRPVSASTPGGGTYGFGATPAAAAYELAKKSAEAPRV